VTFGQEPLQEGAEQVVNMSSHFVIPFERAYNPLCGWPNTPSCAG